MAALPETVLFDDLTLAHFREAPVWVNCYLYDYDEPWYDEVDEEAFRPWTAGLPCDPRGSLFLVHAEFMLKDGTCLEGTVRPMTEQQARWPERDLGLMQPAIWLLDGKRLSFWFGVLQPTDDDCNETYAALGRAAQELFPIRFAAKDGLTVGIASGTLNGFYWLRGEQGHDEVGMRR